MSAKATLGRSGEEHVAFVLRGMGYEVELVAGVADHDLLVAGRVRAEVKAALETSRTVGGREYPVWQFSLRRHGRPVDEDLVFLCCYDDPGRDPRAVFVLPGGAVDEDLTKIDITSEPERYAGRWAWCADRWDTVRAVVGGGQLAFGEGAGP